MEELGQRRRDPLGGLRGPRPGQEEIHHGADQQGAHGGTQTRRRYLFRRGKKRRMRRQQIEKRCGGERKGESVALMAMGKVFLGRMEPTYHVDLYLLESLRDV